MFHVIFENVRRKAPLIHNITNYVTVNDCANILLACGGSPIMADERDDVEQMPNDTLQAIRDAVDVPIVAIGGINRDNLLQLSGSGVDGVALVSAIFSAEDIEETCRELRSLSERMVNL